MKKTFAKLLQHFLSKDIYLFYFCIFAAYTLNNSFKLTTVEWFGCTPSVAEECAGRESHIIYSSSPSLEKLPRKTNESKQNA